MKYQTIVVDPPWPYPDDKRGWGVGLGDGSWRSAQCRKAMPYQSMSLADIRALPVGSLAESAAHLYLWTTNRHLHEAFHAAAGWGFRHAQTLVWAKAPLGSFLGGAFGANVEFVLFCRRGVLATRARIPTCWFEWPRVGTGAHSRKPDAFLDLVEQVSPGPYVELFARRARFGWDYWGDESLQTAEMPAA